MANTIEKTVAVSVTTKEFKVDCKNILELKTAQISTSARVKSMDTSGHRTVTARKISNRIFTADAALVVFLIMITPYNPAERKVCLLYTSPHFLYQFFFHFTVTFP